jgi:puromycin-sensitive aminopeptidase
VRLPSAVRPSRYCLELHLDLESKCFWGTELVELEATERQEFLRIHALGLEISASCFDDQQVPFRLVGDELHLRSPVAIGKHTLKVSFSGTLDGQLKGLYSSRSTSGELAVTQFEPDYARLVFPCFDEPEFKAVFELTVNIPEGLEAVSNASIARRQGKRVEFGPTPKMSSYLVALAVGPLVVGEEFDSDGVAVRVLATPGKVAFTGFAAEVAKAMLPVYKDYYQQPYPGKKLDLVGVPDFGSGAMENLGAVIFREAALLIDPDQASLENYVEVAITVAHELAHMWFGDLVTMKWWDDLWLNEAFATWAETRMVDKWRPKWGMWQLFVEYRSDALALDSLSTSRPIHAKVETTEQAKEMFDVITYKKGAAVLRMLEQALGEEIFREGVRRYLAENAFDNASTEDLWVALAEASGEPVAETMTSWVDRPGFPLVRAERTAEGLKLSQSRFSLETQSISEELWPIPVLYRDSRETPKVWLRRKEQVVKSAEGPVFVNAEGHGCYRVLYGPELWKELLGDLQKLSSLEQLVLLQDTLEVAIAGRCGFERWFQLVEALSLQLPDRFCWRAVGEGLKTVQRFLPSSEHEHLAAWIRSIVRPVFESLGSIPRPTDTEQCNAMRAQLWEILGTVGQDSTIADLSQKVPVEPDLADAAVTVQAFWGDAKRYQEHFQLFTEALSPSEEHRYLYALTRYRDPDLLTRTLSATLDGTIRGQDAGRVFRALISYPSGQQPAVEFMESRWEAMESQWPMQGMRLAIVGSSLVTDPTLVQRLLSFLPAHPVVAGERPLAQTLERLKVGLSVRERLVSPGKDCSSQLARLLNRR